MVSRASKSKYLLCPLTLVPRRRTKETQRDKSSDRRAVLSRVCRPRSPLCPMKKRQRGGKEKSLFSQRAVKNHCSRCTLPFTLVQFIDPVEAAAAAQLLLSSERTGGCVSLCVQLSVLLQVHVLCCVCVC